MTNRFRFSTNPLQAKCALADCTWRKRNINVMCMNFHRAINKLTLATLRFHLTAIYSIFAISPNSKNERYKTYLTGNKTHHHRMCLSHVLSRSHAGRKIGESERVRFDERYWRWADTGIHLNKCTVLKCDFCAVEKKHFRFSCFARECVRNWSGNIWKRVQFSVGIVV